MNPEPTIYTRSADDLFCNLDPAAIEDFADLPSPPDPSPQQDPATNSNDNNPPTPAEVYDPNVIPPAQVAQTNNELTAHLQRQGGAPQSSPSSDDEDINKKTSTLPDPSAEDIASGNAKAVSPAEEAHEKTVVQPSEREDAQEEFFKHLRRQKIEEREAELAREEGGKVAEGSLKLEGMKDGDESVGKGEGGTRRDPGW